MDQLILISNTFEEWRYSFEAKHPLVLDINFLQAFTQATAKTLPAHCGDVDCGEAVIVESETQINRKFEEGIEEQKQAAIEKFLQIQKKRGKK